MSPFLGSIAIFAGNYAPKGYAFCNGQLLGISQNAALYSLLGIAYGGNGSSTFALPDLRGRLPVHFGGTAMPIDSTTSSALGLQVGAENVTLNTAQIPAHTHTLQGSSAAATLTTASNSILATPSQRIYGTGGTIQTLANTSITATGGGLPHSNLQPYLVLNFVIALVGIYPSRP